MIRVWDTTSGKKTLTLDGHVHMVSCAIFSRDGKRIFSSGAQDRSVKVWDAIGGQELLTLPGFAGGIFGLALSPDGTKLAGSSPDGTLMIWAAPSQAVPSTIDRGSSPKPPPTVVAQSTRPRDPPTKTSPATTPALPATPDRPENTGSVPAGQGTLPRLLCSVVAGNKSEISLLSLEGARASLLGKRDGTGSNDSAAVWSPDGKLIAFDAERDGARNLYVMDADGRNVKQVTRDRAGNWKPGWSPDGKMLVFTRNVPGGTMEVCKINIDGSGLVNLTNHPAADTDPAWSPDGKKIAFASFREGKGYRLFVMDADGTNVQMLSTRDNVYGYVHPAWSPDSKKIVYGDTTGSAVDLFVCDADGKNNQQLTRLGYLNSLPAWSPDGKRIAFVHPGPNQSNALLYLMDADGTNVRRITGFDGFLKCDRLAWEPR